MTVLSIILLAFCLGNLHSETTSSTHPDLDISWPLVALGWSDYRIIHSPNGSTAVYYSPDLSITVIFKKCLKDTIDSSHDNTLDVETKNDIEYFRNQDGAIILFHSTIEDVIHFQHKIGADFASDYLLFSSSDKYHFRAELLTDPKLKSTNQNTIDAFVDFYLSHR